MKAYLVALALGMLAGVIYGAFQVRSPAPPVIALVGLLGMLLGEQVPPLVRQMLDRQTSHASWLERQVKPHVFGELPAGDRGAGARLPGSAPSSSKELS